MSVRYIQINNPWFLEQDNAGRPAAGYLVYTLQAGSVSTLLTTYSNKELTAPNTNPIVLNYKGEANIYTTSQLKLVYCAPSGDLTSPIWTEDYVGVVSSEDLRASATPTTVNNVYRVSVSPAPVSLTDRLELIMTPDVDSLSTLVLLPGRESTTVFTGTGANDGIFTGPYVGNTAGSVFTVQIDSVSAGGDTFRWKKDGGGWVTHVAILGNNATQQLMEGIAITFSANLGHTLWDQWTVQVMTPVKLNVNDLGSPSNKIVYKNVAGTLKALAAGDIKAGIPATMVYSAIQDCWILNNPSTATAISVFGGGGDGGGGGVVIIPCTRKELYTTYQMVTADGGNVMSCNGSFTIYLPTAPQGANTIFYIKRKTAGTILIDARGYLIYGYGSNVGKTIFTLGQNIEAVQLQSNSIDWEIIGMVVGPPIPGTNSWTTPGTYYWMCPIGTFFIDIIGLGGGGGGVGGYGQPGFDGQPSYFLEPPSGYKLVANAGLGGSGLCDTDYTCAYPTGNGGYGWQFGPGPWGNPGQSGATASVTTVPVNPGTLYTVVVGAGGDGGGYGSGVNGSPGGPGYININY